MIPWPSRPTRTLLLSGLAISLLAASGSDADGGVRASAGAGDALGVGAESGTEEVQKPRVETPIPTKKPRGPKAPDFSLTLLDGTAVQLSDYAGQVVIVDFWATWCNPCRMSIPHLIELQNEHAERGFTVLGVSLDRAGRNVVDQFATKTGINYPVGLGNQGIARAYGGVQSIPMAFIVDRDGYVAKVIRGYQPKEAIESVIVPLLEEKASVDG
jgi:peroxiredoxin